MTRTRSQLALSEAKAGRLYTVTEIRGGEELRRRLADMGLGPGAVFSVEHNPGHGTLVAAVKGSRLVLGRGMVERIMVSVCI